MSAHQKLQVDSLAAAHDVACSGSLTGEVLYLGNMKIISSPDSFRIFHLKPDHVPTSIQNRDSSVLSSAALDINSWARLAFERGWFTSVSEVFPLNAARFDFVEELLTKQVSDDLAALTVTVGALDSLYSTDAERVAAFQTALAQGGDIFAGNDNTRSPTCPWVRTSPHPEV